MKRFLAILALLLAADAWGAEWMVKSSVKTRHTVQETATSWLHEGGSGTVIRKDADTFYVLSCCHVASYRGVVNCGQLTVTYGGTAYPARVVAYDVGLDLSLIEATGRAGVVPVAVVGGGDHDPV